MYKIHVLRNDHTEFEFEYTSIEEAILGAKEFCSTDVKRVFVFNTDGSLLGMCYHELFFYHDKYVDTLTVNL